MSFQSLGLSASLNNAIKQLYTEPTPLQGKIIPIVLDHKDLMVFTPPRTGKIASFILPIIEKLFPDGEAAVTITPKQSHALILVANTSHAIRISDYFKAYAHGLPLSVACTAEYTNLEEDSKSLESGVHILITTPDDLLELSTKQAIDLSAIKTLVLDELELLTTPPFDQIIPKILSLLAVQRQNILFSAVPTPAIQQLATDILNDPIHLDITSEIHNSITTIKQSVFYIPTRQKPALLAHIIQNKLPDNTQTTLVFTRTKHTANRLCHYLQKKGIDTVTINGYGDNTLITLPLPQVLITTDLPIQNIEHSSCYIVNYDLPFIESDYIERIRSIKKLNEVISFVNPEEEKLLLVIESFINQKIADSEINDFVFDNSEMEDQPERFRRIFRHPAIGRKSRKNQHEKHATQETEKTTEKTEQPPCIESKTATPKRPRNKLFGQHHRFSKQKNTPITTNSPDTTPINRPDDEFRDDEYDNFGNSVNYISPYEGKATQKPNPHYTPRAKKNSLANGRPASNNAKLNNGRTQKSPFYKRNNTKSMYTPITVSTRPPEPKEPTQQRNHSTTAIIHRKHSRLDKLPTIEQLDSLSNRHLNRTEKPVLLTRRNIED